MAPHWIKALGIWWCSAIVLMTVHLRLTEGIEETNCPGQLDRLCKCSSSDGNASMSVYRVLCHGARFSDIHTALGEVSLDVGVIIINTKHLDPDTGLLNIGDLQLPNLEVFVLVGSQIEEIVPTNALLESNSTLKTFQLTHSPLGSLENGSFKAFGRLTTLLLFHNELQHISKGAFQGLDNLRSLTLSNNKLRQLPCKVFTGLNKLRSLHLDNNELSVVHGCWWGDDPLTLQHVDLRNNGIQILEPKTFSALGKLNKLQLSGNRIKTLPSGVFQKLQSLTCLELDNNTISDIETDAFKGLTNLTHLDVSNNKLVALTLTTFKHLANLRTLTLGRNPLHQVPSGVFQGLSNLQELSMNDMPELRGLQEGCFQGLRNLWSLEIKGCKHLTTLDRPLTDLPKLERVNFSGNGLVSLDKPLLESAPLLWLAAIGNNQYHCDCKVAWIRQRSLDQTYTSLHPWIRMWTEVYFDVNTPQCSTPPALQGRRIVDLSSADLTCKTPIVIPMNGHRQVVVEGRPMSLGARLTRGLPTSYWVLPDETKVYTNRTIVLAQPRVVIESQERLENGREWVVTLTVTGLTNRPYLCGEFRLVASNGAGETIQTFLVVCAGDLATTGNLSATNMARFSLSKMPSVNVAPSGEKSRMNLTLVLLCSGAVLVLLLSTTVIYRWKCHRRAERMLLEEDLSPINGTGLLNSPVTPVKDYGATNNVTA